MIQKINMNSTEFKPNGDLVLVKVQQKRKDDEKTSAFGIVIEQAKLKSVNDRPSFGCVIAVGSKVTDIEAGDWVVFPNTDGQDVHFNDTEENYLTDDLAQFIILRQVSILGKKKI